MTPVKAPQQDQKCVQRLRTDSQRHHPQSLETLLQVHTSHLQPDEAPLGVGKLANETLSGCCPSPLTKEASQKMAQSYSWQALFMAFTVAPKKGAEWILDTCYMP